MTGAGAASLAEPTSRPSDPPAPGFRADINGLRAVAVAAVVLFHAGIPGTGGGFVGVDVFFVISGFLMTRIISGGILRGRFQVTGFWAARARRIAPALLVLCVVLAVSGWFAIDPITYAAMARDMANSVLFTSNIQDWREFGYFDRGAGTKWLLHTWSLSVECQFYLAYPLLLAVAARWFGRRSITPLLWVGLVLSLAFSVGVTAWRPSFAFYMLPSRAWELIAGGLVDRHAGITRRINRGAGRACETAGCLLILLAIIGFAPETPWPSFRACLPVLGTMLVLAADAGGRSLLAPSAVQALGLWSYSIYLWHWPVIVAFRYFGVPPSLASTSLEIVLGLGLGCLSFMLVERPTQRWLKRRSVGGVSAAIGVPTAIVMAGAVAILLSGGAISRALRPGLIADFEQAQRESYLPKQDCRRAGIDRTVFICWIGSETAQDALIIGDSHADQWHPRLEQEAGLNVVSVTRQGCPPLPGVRRAAAGADCPDFFRLAIRTAREGRFKRVLFTADWIGDFERHDPPDEVCIEEAHGCVSPSSDPEGMRRVFDRFAATLGDLAHESRVTILLPMPTPGVDLPLALAERDFRGLSKADLETVSAEAMRAAGGTVRGLLIRAAAAAGATVIDPIASLCRDGTCRFVDPAGRSLYVDQTHVRSSVITTGAYDLLDAWARGNASAQSLPASAGVKSSPPA